MFKVDVYFRNTEVINNVNLEKGYKLFGWYGIIHATV